MDAPPPPAAAARELAWAAAAGLATWLLQVPLLGLAPLAVRDAELAALTTAAPATGWSAGGLAGLVLASTGEVGALRHLLALSLALVSALTYLLARRLALPPAAALVGAGLVTLHPLAVESGAWLARGGASFGFALALAALLAALTCNERARRVALPLALASLFVLPAALAGPREPLPEALELSVRLSHAPLAPGAHLARWLLVAPLSWFHPHPALAGAGELGLGSLTTLASVALVVLLRRRAPLVAAGLALFLALALAGAVAPRAPELAPEDEGARVGLGLTLAVLVGTRPAWSRHPRAALGLALVLLCGLAARSLERQRAWRDERALQTAALVAEPGNVQAELGLARLELARGRLSECERRLAALAARFPREAGVPALAGELALRRALLPGQERHLVAARDALEQARALGPEAARVLECLGEVHQRARDEAAALRLHEAALALEPWRARALELAGKAALNLGDVQEAERQFTRLCAAWPENVEGWCGLGYARRATGDSAAAREAFERALALEPDHPEASAGLAQVLELAGERAAALRHYRRALAVNPDLVEALYAGARLLEASDAARALEWLERLVARQGAPRPHVRAHLAAARLWLARGERETARARLATVLAAVPEQAEARALLNEIERGDG